MRSRSATSSPSRSPAGVRVLKIAATGDRRGPAAEARLLYEDLSPPPPAAGAARQTAAAAGRPSATAAQLDEFLGGGDLGKDFPPDED